MLMAFPERNWLGNPKGWKYKGQSGETYDPEKKVYMTLTHTFCKTIVHVGIEKGEPFRFCPLCEVKL